MRGLCFRTRTYLMLLGLGALAGCMSVSNTRLEVKKAIGQLASISLPAYDVASEADINAAFARVVGGCADVLSTMEFRADRRRLRLLTTAVVGSIAGSVAAPAVIASEGSMALSAGLSGLGGASNTAQQLFADNGYSHTELVLARERVVVDLNGYVNRWQALDVGASEATPEEQLARRRQKISLLQGMVFACSSFSLSPTEMSEEVEAVLEPAAEGS